MLLSGGLGLLGFGVNLADNDGGFEGEVSGEGFPGRSELLAV